MQTILLCDDEENIRHMIRKYAEYDGFEVEEAADGEEALKLADQKVPDLVIMDVMMPGMDGFAACRRLREKYADLPFIMLTALDQEYDKIHAFHIGVDDYVVKPFSPRELMMRIRAILRRSSKDGSHIRRFVQEGLEIDFDAYTVQVDQHPVMLSLKEFDLLAFLIRHGGQVMPRQRILHAVWGDDFYGDERTLDTHIKLLRKQLGPYSRWLATVRGVGYRFEKQDIAEK